MYMYRSICTHTVFNVMMITLYTCTCIGQDWLVNLQLPHTAGLLRIQHRLLSLLPYYLTPTNWKETAQEVTKLEEGWRGSVNGPVWEEVYSLSQNVCSSLLAYCQNAMTAGGTLYVHVHVHTHTTYVYTYMYMYTLYICHTYMYKLCHIHVCTCTYMYTIRTCIIMYFINIHIIIVHTCLLIENVVCRIWEQFIVLYVHVYTLLMYMYIIHVHVYVYLHVCTCNDVHVMIYMYIYVHIIIYMYTCNIIYMYIIMYYNYNYLFIFLCRN